MTARISVVLADDHAMVRDALARILKDSGLIDVVGQANDGSEVAKVVERTSPQCVVLDYSMPNLDAPQVIEMLVRRQPQIKILVLTVHDNVHYAVRALEAGAHGYMIKSAAADELVTAIKAVRNGEVYFSPRVSNDVVRLLCRPKRQRVGLESLSQREFDFLRSLGSGKTLQECASQLKISVSTASTYRARIMEKLKLESTAELIRYALENGIVD